ncbi:MAG: methyltransferase domain-containing protein [Holophaga sp.]|nr:methyltransferase domain-containing protein [Holophaga sp.]
MPVWNPGQYLKFGAERTRPAVDLCARITGSPERILDLGCGPGNSTAVLRERWPEAELAGLDSSPEMLAQARASHPNGTWILAGAESYEPPAPLDLVFSNAVLQWLPDHRRLLPKIMGWVAPGGCLAVQMPAKGGTKLRAALAVVAERPRWRDLLAGAGGALNFLDASVYYDLLAPGADRVDLWETIYHHPMASHQALIEWYEGTGMRPFLERLPDDAARAAFKAEVLEACRADFPVMADGKVVMPFKRLFFVAWKA